MLQLSKKTDYAIVILAHFAKFADQPVLSAKEVASGTHLPGPTVAKILKTLVREGLLTSLQGSKGGYQLARPSGDISISQIIEAMNDPLALTECAVGTPGLCKTENWCSLRTHWGVINQVIRQALEKLPLSAMVEPDLLAALEKLPKDGNKDFELFQLARESNEED